MGAASEMPTTYLEVNVVLQLQDKVAELRTEQLDHMKDGCEVLWQTMGKACEEQLIPPKGAQWEFHTLKAPQEAESLQVEEATIRSEDGGERTIHGVAQREDIPATIPLKKSSKSHPW